MAKANGDSPQKIAVLAAVLSAARGEPADHISLNPMPMTDKPVKTSLSVSTCAYSCGEGRAAANRAKIPAPRAARRERTIKYPLLLRGRTGEGYNRATAMAEAGVIETHTRRAQGIVCETIQSMWAPIHPPRNWQRKNTDQDVADHGTRRP